jgi:sortase A
MAFALVFALVTAVLTVLPRNVPERAAASEKVPTAKSSAGPLIRGESSVEPWREKARPLPVPEVSKNESNPAPSGGGAKAGSAPAPKAERASQPEPVLVSKPKARAEPKPGHPAPTVGESGWTRPTSGEIEAANGPRHYDLPAGAIMSLTMGSISIYGAPVFDSASPMALAKGVAHLPDTSLPWSDTPQEKRLPGGAPHGFSGDVEPHALLQPR